MVVALRPLAFERPLGFGSEAKLSAGNGRQLLEGGVKNPLGSSYVLKYTQIVGEQFPLFFLQPCISTVSCLLGQVLFIGSLLFFFFKQIQYKNVKDVRRRMERHTDLLSVSHAFMTLSVCFNCV